VIAPTGGLADEVEPLDEGTGGPTGWFRTNRAIWPSSVTQMLPSGPAPIPPGVRHRAAGRMTILDVVVSPFDAADDWFD
jgi:hypothetical protein